MPDEAATGPLRDDPLPENPQALAAEIRALAALRRNDALRHEDNCPCNGCRVLRHDALLRRMKSADATMRRVRNAAA